MSRQQGNISAGTQVASLRATRDLRSAGGSPACPGHSGAGGSPASFKLHCRCAHGLDTENPAPALRDRLLAVKRGDLTWAQLDTWRKELHRDFERALAETKLPERPDYEAANRFLVKARKETAVAK